MRRGIGLARASARAYRRPIVVTAAEGADVKLINTDGLVLVGPGSEWLWAAAQFVVVIVTMIGLYRQLRQGNAGVAIARIETLQKTWDSRQMTHAKVRACLAMRYGDEGGHGRGDASGCEPHPRRDRALGARAFVR